MPSSLLKVSIRTMNSILELNVSPNSIAKELFNEVVKTLRLKESWYFGLHYIDSKNVPSWLRIDKKISKHDFREGPSQTITLLFRARLYPEEISTELIEDITQELFFLQVKESILSDEIYCPAETAVLLASYAMQAKYGDYDERTHGKSVTFNERILSKHVIKQYRLSIEEWEQHIVNWWKEHQGLMNEDARMEYLKIAQDLEMYGIHYFEIRNKKKTELYLGIDALGINIYDRKDKVIPKIGFPWSEIGNVSYDKKKFIIKPAESKAPNFIFFVERRRINRQILSLCRANHALYTRRRRTDPPEIQEMKRIADMNRSTRRREYQREQEQKRQNNEERQVTSSPNDKLQNTLDYIAREKPPRMPVRSNSEITPLTEQAETIKQTSEQFNRPATNLSQNIKNQEKTQSVFQAQQSPESDRVSNPSNEYEEPNDPVTDSENDENSSNNGRHEIQFEINLDAPRHEEERSPVVKQDQIIQDKFQMTRQDLEKQQKHEATEDQIYRENFVDKGIDKYKTLKRIREGTVKRRIDEFEAM